VCVGHRLDRPLDDRHVADLELVLGVLRGGGGQDDELLVVLGPARADRERAGLDDGLHDPATDRDLLVHVALEGAQHLGDRDVRLARLVDRRRRGLFLGVLGRRRGFLLVAAAGDGARHQHRGREQRCQARG